MFYCISYAKLQLFINTDIKPEAEYRFRAKKHVVHVRQTFDSITNFVFLKIYCHTKFKDLALDGVVSFPPHKFAPSPIYYRS
jgi:hypothetical protein